MASYSARRIVGLGLLVGSLSLADAGCSDTEPSGDDGSESSGDESGGDALPTTQTDVYADYPEALSSFGAAVLDDHLYVYSGHIGTTHEHSEDNLSQAFRSLDLGDPSASWRTLTFRDPVQSASLVAHEGALYRTGGMVAYNGYDELHEELESVAAFERYDPQADAWTELPALPGGRSSHDAVVVDGVHYVFGGWQLSGSDSTSGVFYDHGLRFDLSSGSGAWEEVPQPFQRRALCVATDGARVYVIGGLDQDNQGSVRTDVYDPAQGTWSAGPNAPGGDDPFVAFGCSSFGVGGRVYLTLNDGFVRRLAEDGQSWEPIATMVEPRFFMRLVAPGPESLLLVAGVATEADHLADIEVLPL
ncbi:MAG: hypothetical protein KDK70_12440 [Myxococcales bacterium]|nr:hypothetical protein [Myxococcales bacterium]